MLSEFNFCAGKYHKLDKEMSFTFRKFCNIFKMYQKLTAAEVRDDKKN